MSNYLSLNSFKKFLEKLFGRSDVSKCSSSDTWTHDAFGRPSSDARTPGTF